MKRICLVAGILSFSVIGFAQQQRIIETQRNDTIVKVITIPEKRTSNAVAELANLKTSQVQHHQHLYEVQTTLPVVISKKKLVVNRVGSKQLQWSKE